MLSLLVAVSENGVIGKDDVIPWHISSDLQRFKLLTLGHTVVMGRKTLDSIVQKLGKPLPDRRNLVLTRQPGYSVDRVETIDAGLLKNMADETQEVFVIGGGEVYQLALPLASRVYLTRVYTSIEGGDAFFPDLPESDWILECAVRYDSSEKDEHPFSYQIFTRT